MEYSLRVYLFEHKDFPQFVLQVAETQKIPAAIVEKDYWVTYLLFRLQRSEFNGKFIFKGGTSLSKGWKLLERFSEDIDLLFVTEDGMSMKKKRSQLEKVRNAVGTYEGLLFDKDNPDNAGGNESRAACYRYKRDEKHSSGSLRPYLKLEMGYRGGTEPSETREIQSYIGEELVKAGESKMADDVGSFEMEILHPTRTLIEKLFAVHAAAVSHQTREKWRHYYDIYKLLSLKDVHDFVGSPEYAYLKKSVYEFTKQEFPKSPLPDLLKFGNSPGINLSNELRAVLQKEIESSELIFGKKPTMDEIISSLHAIRDRL